MRTQYNWRFCSLRCWRSVILGAVFSFFLSAPKIADRQQRRLAFLVNGASFKRD